HSIIHCSALEIAREAGWDETKEEIESRVRAAISALERAGYIERGKNSPRVYATSIRVNSMVEASDKIEKSPFFSEEYRETAKRIIKSLITSKATSDPQADVAESRVDYLADILGLTKETVINSITLMRQEGILSDTQDMTAQLLGTDTENKARLELERFAKLEEFFFNFIGESPCEINLKEINENAISDGISTASVKNLRTIIYFWQIRNYIKRREGTNSVCITPIIDVKKLKKRFSQRIDICHFVIKELYQLSLSVKADKTGNKTIQFSFIDLFNSYKAQTIPAAFEDEMTTSDFEEALLYLSKIRSINIVGGFLVLYNALELHRIVKDNKLRYKQEDYRYFDEFYKHRIQQIHIVGEYANLMVRDYDAALNFVRDYFQMDFKKFIATYFKGQRASEIQRNITPEQYNKLFGSLSKVQEEIITDDVSSHIVVAAGPGSGKTRVLVHKLAALLTLEDIKHEQLLMLTFSRAAATEFKQRLRDLIGNAANYVEIKTFHSYCFDLLGRIGTIELSDEVVSQAADLIIKGEIEQGKITKRVLVIDEAQDMDADAFKLVQALMHQNGDMRVIAVGDDDQNIYNFRGSDSRFFQQLITKYNATRYELVDNYRSKKEIVALANEFIKPMRYRLKTTPINSVHEDKGEVRIIEHTSKFMQEALLRNVMSESSGRKIGVLTN
ncbi:MAG: UvrD-helicase domain-containing protein, partial [Kiritimatiellae bacterium]|nr:UvrD-helicase domain-containing protein [Kiritimatiellia bacterium]